MRFGAKNNVDYIAASFVRRPSDVLDIRRVLEEEGRDDIQIIVKIENQKVLTILKRFLKLPMVSW